MSSNYKYIKRKASKGERLKWTPLKDVKPVILTPGVTQGKMLRPEAPSKAKASCSTSINLIVP